jgi:hypothetical protein
MIESCLPEDMIFTIVERAAPFKHGTNSSGDRHIVRLEKEMN